MQYRNEEGKLSLDKKSIIMIAAFAAVYILWGSTYLAIKVGIETFPPFIMAGGRFFVAGSILFFAAMRTADFEWPKAVHWKTSFIVGTLLLLGGNGGVVIASHYVSSSVTALLVATEPFFIVILSWLWLKNARPGSRTTLGLIVGFVGVALLILGQANGGNSAVGGYGMWIGTVAVIAAALSWAAGSIYGLKSPVPRSSMLTAGMQMMAGGFVLLIVSIIRGEWWTVDVAAISGRSWFAVGYLIVCGSLIGFTAYSWLLKNAQPSMVATYAYVNPVVAVILGWGIAGESLTLQMLLGAVVVIASVALITSRKKAKPETEVEAGTEDVIHRSLTPSCNKPNYSTSS